MKEGPISLRRVRVLFTVLVFALAHAAAAASSRGVDAAFGNTIRSTYPDGRQAELWLSPDGAYRANGRRGDDLSGAWRIRGSQLCLRQRRPFPAPFSYCTHIPGSLNGEWVARAVTGETIRVALVRGHSLGRKGPPR